MKMDWEVCPLTLDTTLSEQLTLEALTQRNANLKINVGRGGVVGQIGPPIISMCSGAERSAI